MIKLNTETFTKVVEGEKGFVVVDFFTTTCGPCRVIAKTFSTQEEKHKDIKFGKIEPGDGHDIFVKYNVGYVPTLILFQDGKEISRKGFLNESELETWLKETKNIPSSITPTPPQPIT